MRVPFGSSKISARSCGQNSPSMPPSGVTFTVCAVAELASTVPSATPRAHTGAIQVERVMLPPAGRAELISYTLHERTPVLPWINPSSADRMADIRDTSLAQLVRDDVLRAITRGELASTGLVAARKHAGVFVRVLAPKEVADLYELRSVLDGHAGTRVAALPD